MSDQTEWTVTDFGLVRLNGKDMVTALTYDQGKALVDAINAALAVERSERCEVCNTELSQCGTQGVDGEPSMDCLVCKLREQLAVEREKVETLVDALEQVLSETVDARDYPDGPCLNASTRTEIKDALAKVKETK